MSWTASIPRVPPPNPHCCYMKTVGPPNPSRPQTKPPSTDHALMPRAQTSNKPVPPHAPVRILDRSPQAVPHRCPPAAKPRSRSTPVAVQLGRDETASCCRYHPREVHSHPPRSPAEAGPWVAWRMRKQCIVGGTWQGVIWLVLLRYSASSGYTGCRGAGVGWCAWVGCVGLLRVWLWLYLGDWCGWGSVGLGAVSRKLSVATHLGSKQSPRRPSQPQNADTHSGPAANTAATNQSTSPSIDPILFYISSPHKTQCLVHGSYFGPTPAPR